MKLKRSTQVLLLLAVIFGGGVLLYEGAVAPEFERQRQEEQRAFRFRASAIRQMTLTRSDYTVQLTRLDEPLQIPSEDETRFSTTEWQYVMLENGDPQGEANPANDAYVSFLLMVLDNARSDRPIVTTADNLGEYGLDNPRARLRIELDDGEVQELWVGDRDFTGSFVYGWVHGGDEALGNNPDEEAEEDAGDSREVSVILLPLNVENAVNRSRDDWQAQPLPAAPDEDIPQPEIPEQETPEAEVPDEDSLDGEREEEAEPEAGDAPESPTSEEPDSPDMDENGN
ncbi:DUF4340 domain-containing protein [Phormidium yuhuli AB48]|uniref:DUF4340 domain-containing protein n=1 Tax=Phormidium yuhuli AB48 TaxID=2940671 RepID=A0ABY5AU93_9CYAN|nr:DUF4340 domain-containing protein [Phormidium yuhuli]USR92803.1 DUF4340 domain-containing protein [Phormidium yuhuli AB48]